MFTGPSYCVYSRRVCQEVRISSGKPSASDVPFTWILRTLHFARCLIRHWEKSLHHMEADQDGQCQKVHRTVSFQGPRSVSERNLESLALHKLSASTFAELTCCVCGDCATLDASITSQSLLNAHLSLISSTFLSTWDFNRRYGLYKAAINSKIFTRASAAQLVLRR